MAERRVDGLGPFHGTALTRGQNGLASAEAVPLHYLVFADGLHLIAVDGLDLLGLSRRAALAEGAYNSSTTTNRVGARLALGFLHFGHGAHLVEISFEDGGVGDVLGGLGELKKHDAGADDEEASNDCDNGCDGAFEALKEDSRGDNRGRGEVDVVGGRDQGRVEDVERFLGEVSAVKSQTGVIIRPTLRKTISVSNVQTTNTNKT